MEDQQIPAAYICPLTHGLIMNPVLDITSGITYDKEAIEDWLNRSGGKNPIDPSKHMNIESLVPNRALKESIDAYMSSHKLQVEPKININIQVNKVLNMDKYLLALNPNASEKLPIHLICVLDISGSMNQCDTEGKPGLENVKYSRFDLTKHCFRTMISALNSNSKVSIVTFNNKSIIMEKCVTTTDTNKQMLLDRLDDIDPDSTTDIIAGLRNGITCANDTPNMQSVIVIFTDGEPNVEPASGYTVMIDHLTTSLKNIEINTMLFGNDISLNIMKQISSRGNGMSYYISDFSMIGTVIINFTCNMLLTYAKEVKINDHPICDLHTGQTYYLLFNEVPKQLSYKDIHGKIIRTNLQIGSEPANIDKVYESMARQNLIDIIRTILSSHESTKTSKWSEFVENIIKNFISKWSSSNNEFIKNVVKEFVPNDDSNNGQIKLAITSFYNTWGQLFLTTMLDVHIRQICFNFRSPSLKLYANDKFNTERLRLDEMFARIEPPKIKQTVDSSYSRPSSPPPSMSAIANSDDGGCIFGSVVTEVMHNNVTTLKQIQDIVPGDYVRSWNDKFVPIRLVIKTHLTNINLVHIDDNLVLTKYHPIQKIGTTEWIFPGTTKSQISYHENIILYDFVLPQKEVLKIRNYMIATLAHGINGNIIGHPYLATSIVYDDLMKMSKNYIVDVYPNNIIRNSETGLIEKFIM